MSQRLTVTSSELRDTSADMRRGAESIHSELDLLLGRVRTLVGSWTGQAASAFEGYYDQANQGMSQCHQALEGIAQMLDGSAQGYDEMEAGITRQFQ